MADAKVKPTENAELFLEATGPIERRGEPVTCGLPWPRGVLPDDCHLIVEDERGTPVLVQTRTLDRWSDGSCRWVLLDWLANVRGTARYRARVGGAARPQAESGPRVEERDG